MIRHRLAPLSTILVALVTVIAACDGGAAATAAASASEEHEAGEHAAGESEAAEPADGGEESEVRMADFEFEPGELTIPVGTEVVFINDDVAEHTVTEGTDGDAVDDPFVDEEVAAGDEIRVTFDEAGTFDITCRLHPDMQMTITVEG